MARTDKFRQQHTDLLTLAGELQALLNAEALSKNGSAARTCLGKLMGKLGLHLAAEDKVLYPELAAHKDPAVAALARRFSAEMKSTAAQVVAYNTRWPTPSSIMAASEAFCSETKRVISILADRISRENHDLYAAADRVEGKAFA